MYCYIVCSWYCLQFLNLHPKSQRRFAFFSNFWKSLFYNLRSNAEDNDVWMHHETWARWGNCMMLSLRYLHFTKNYNYICLKLKPPLLYQGTHDGVGVVITSGVGDNPHNTRFFSEIIFLWSAFSIKNGFWNRETNISKVPEKGFNWN